MLKKDLVRSVVLDEQTVEVAMGDSVWYFGAAQINQCPVPATVMAFGEDEMIDLVYTEPSIGKPVVLKGICMVGDRKLDNMVHRKRGAWCPRGTWTCLNLKEA